MADLHWINVAVAVSAPTEDAAFDILDRALSSECDVSADSGIVMWDHARRVREECK